jgi:hypothetical protein
MRHYWCLGELFLLVWLWVGLSVIDSQCRSNFLQYVDYQLEQNEYFFGAFCSCAFPPSDWLMMDGVFLLRAVCPSFGFMVTFAKYKKIIHEKSDY